jgi:hypothetical protein
MPAWWSLMHGAPSAALPVGGAAIHSELSTAACVLAGPLGYMHSCSMCSMLAVLPLCATKPHTTRTDRADFDCSAHASEWTGERWSGVQQLNRGPTELECRLSNTTRSSLSLHVCKCCSSTCGVLIQLFLTTTKLQDEQPWRHTSPCRYSHKAATRMRNTATRSRRRSCVGGCYLVSLESPVPKH